MKESQDYDDFMDSVQRALYLFDQLETMLFPTAIADLSRATTCAQELVRELGLKDDDELSRLVTRLQFKLDCLNSMQKSNTVPYTVH